MPEINSITEVLHQPNQPYHYFYDNMPLRNILARIDLVNIQVDTNTDVLRGASGSAGTLDNRLNVSLESDGKLKSSAVDESLHNIANHLDGTDSLGIEYVRMRKEERNKLQLIASGANKFSIEIEDSHSTIGEFVTIPSEDTETLSLQNSSTIFFDFIAPNILKAHAIFPPDAAHRHHYDLIPAYDVPSAPSYKFYRTTAINTPYMPGSLKVYINGIKITNSVGIKVLDYSSNAASWISTFIANESPSDGTFELNRALSEDDIIRIDFDTSFAPLAPTATPTSTAPTATPTSTAPTATPASTVTATPTSTAPTPTPTSTSSECFYIECGGTMAYADCGLINEPGYVSTMDCDLCKCVKNPVPTPTPTEI